MVTTAECKHHPGQDCGCYCRFMGCSPRNCAVGEMTEAEKPKPPKAEPFEPRMMVMPLDGSDGLYTNRETTEWIVARLLKGDPGPLYVDGGRVWTDASEAEAAEERGVEVRPATSDEQRQALERTLDDRGVRLPTIRLSELTSKSSGGLNLRRGLVVTVPVMGTTATLRQAREESVLPEGRSVLVIRRSGRAIERITGTILSGRRGYVVRAEGVAVEASRSSYDRANVGVALVHRLVAYPGDEEAQNEGIEPRCELVGGACKSCGPVWDFYQQLEVAMEGWTSGEPPAAFWEILEGELIRWLEMKEKAG